MVIFNLEYSVLDKLNRAKGSNHVGLFTSNEDVEKAKEKVIQENPDTKIAFNVFVIDDPFAPVR